MADPRFRQPLSGLYWQVDVKDGEAFSGGRPASADEFEDLGVDEEEEEKDALAAKAVAEAEESAEEND